jgi:hypothetical protein
MPARWWAELLESKGNYVGKLQHDETRRGRYLFRHRYQAADGFGLKAEVLEYPGGMPGDIGFFLTWK